MSVHSIYLSMFKSVIGWLDLSFCLIDVGRCLLLFFFSCTQYLIEAVRSFLGRFCIYKRSIFTMGCAGRSGGVTPLAAQVFQITTKL